MSRLKAACVVVALFFACPPSSPLSAQGSGSEAAENALRGKAALLSDVLSRALEPSRLPEIYADLRASARQAYLPALRDALSEGEADGTRMTPREKDDLRALIALLDYSLKASDELEPFLAANRGAIIGDIATLHAKYLSRDEIEALGELLDMPVMGKIFNALYTASRMVTGYSYEDMRSYYAHSAWLRDLKPDFEGDFFSNPDTPPPSPEKLAKANAIVADFLRVSRIDAMVEEILRFAREVQPANGESLEGRDAEIARQTEWLMFFYNLQKSMLLTVAPPALATAFDDRQLNQLHLFVLSPVVAKSFSLIHDSVRAFTALTREDVEALQAFNEEMEAEGLFKERAASDQEQLRVETEALFEIWRERARDHLTPETRAGLDRAIEDIEGIKERRRRSREGRDPVLEPDERQL